MRTRVFSTDGYWVVTVFVKNAFSTFIVFLNGILGYAKGGLRIRPTNPPEQRGVADL